MFQHQLRNKDLYLRIRALARKMRKNSTEAEIFFWEKVRDRRLFGLKINRQFIIQCPIDSTLIKFYVADFHCHFLKMLIELDGQIHLKQQAEDLIRTERMTELGFTVLRFTNEQVLHDWANVELKIKEYMESYLGK